MVRGALVFLLIVQVVTSPLRAQGSIDVAPLEVGSPTAAFAGGPIRLSKDSVALLRAQFNGDNVPLIPQPFRGRLDTALVTSDWPRVETVKQELRKSRGIEAMLLWEQTRFVATGGIGIAEMHALDMADTGATAVSETVAMLWLYSVAVTMTDGHKCADDAAKDAHLELLMGPTFEKATQIVRALPDDRLAAMRELAVRLESVLSVERTDDTMCQAGSLKPALKPDAEWRPAAAASRANLPKTLATLCAVMRQKPIARTEEEPARPATPIPDKTKPNQ